jgi:hypothetical protein
VRVKALAGPARVIFSVSSEAYSEASKESSEKREMVSVGRGFVGGLPGIFKRAGGIAALLGLLTIGAAFTAPRLEAADSLYTAAKVSVDTTAKDAVAAKAAGMAEAQRRGLEIVLKRLVPSGELPELSQEDVEGLVEGVSVLNEQMSTTRYIATLDVSFSEQAVKQLLASYSLGVSEARAPMISVLPIVIEGDAVRSEGAEGWRQAWQALDLTHGMVPVTLLQPRPELSAKQMKAVLDGDEEAFNALKSAYGDTPLVIAVGQAAQGNFVTRLVGTDGAGAINFGRTDKIGQGGAKQAARDAASTAFGIIEERWKTTQGEQPAATEARQEIPEGEQQSEGARPQGEVARSVIARVEFSGLKNWQEMRSKLMNVPGVQALEVNSLSARTASISFEYAGSLGKLQKELEVNGFSFENGEESFVLRSRQ